MALSWEELLNEQRRVRKEVVECHSEFRQRHPSEWVMPWRKDPSDWVDYKDSLVEIMSHFRDFEKEIPILLAMKENRTQLRDIPWKDIVKNIAGGIARADSTLDSAGVILSIDELASYMLKWMDESKIVNDLIKWKIFKGDDIASKLKVLSRPGAYLADLVYTVLLIERKKIRRNVKYVAIGNYAYTVLASQLEVRNECYSSENNTGNVMEALSWFAFEQHRFEFIISVVHHAANIEYRTARDEVPAAMDQTPLWLLARMNTIRACRLLFKTGFQKRRWEDMNTALCSKQK